MCSSSIKVVCGRRGIAMVMYLLITRCEWAKNLDASGCPCNILLHSVMWSLDGSSLFERPRTAILSPHEWTAILYIGSLMNDADIQTRDKLSKRLFKHEFSCRNSYL